jgi:DNA-binding NarL/FixJ family response regulator
VKPTVVIVDDHDGFRSSVRALLETEGFEVAGEAGDGVSALAAVDRLHPSIVLLLHPVARYRWV